MEPAAPIMAITRLRVNAAQVSEERGGDGDDYIACHAKVDRFFLSN